MSLSFLDIAKFANDTYKHNPNLDLFTSKEFIKSNNAENLFDKIFHFNFSQSIIKILK